MVWLPTRNPLHNHSLFGSREVEAGAEALERVLRARLESALDAGRYRRKARGPITVTVDRDEREDSQRVRWGIPPTVYVLGTCGVGCGDLVALRGLPTRSLFLYCDACGSAYPAVNNFNFEFPSVFAPKGIEFPSLAEVEAAFPKEPVGVRGSSPGSFWELIAETRLAAGDAGLARSIAQEVIDTWHQAPKTAFEMRERALRALGDSGGSTPGALVCPTTG